MRRFIGFMDLDSPVSAREGSPRSLMAVIHRAGNSKAVYNRERPHASKAEAPLVAVELAGVNNPRVAVLKQALID
jgi:hypothetical protein